MLKKKTLMYSQTMQNSYENIGASFIKANNINYCAVCYAYYNIECNSIKGEFTNSKHFVLNGNGELIIKGGK